MSIRGRYLNEHLVSEIAKRTSPSDALSLSLACKDFRNMDLCRGKKGSVEKSYRTQEKRAPKVGVAYARFNEDPDFNYFVLYVRSEGAVLIYFLTSDTIEEAQDIDKLIFRKQHVDLNPVFVTHTIYKPILVAALRRIKNEMKFQDVSRTINIAMDNSTSFTPAQRRSILQNGVTQIEKSLAMMSTAA